MARALRIQFPGAFYHVTCRGNEQKKIFVNDEDQYRFLALLAESLETYQVVLYGYILMTNHFHLLVQTVRANLSEFMRRFNICYTGWFNYHHLRCGHLYQGRYKAFLIDADNYLLEVSRYLHLNSVRVRGLRSADYQRQWQHVKGYHWSSLPGYLSEKKVNEFIDYDFVLDMVGDRRAYRAFIVDGLRHDVDSPFKDLKKGLILGDDDFVVRVKDEYIGGGSMREQLSYRRLVCDVIEPEVLLRCVADVLGIDRVLLTQRNIGGVIRGIAADLLYKYSDLTQVQIGRLLGNIDYGAVYQLRRRLKERIKRDMQVQRIYLKIEQKLKGIC
jgi:putative transposase